MASRERLVAASMAIALLSLALLFLHAQSVTPREMRIADVGGDDVGLPVRIRGHVHRVDTTDEGNAAIVLMDYEDFATLRVIARPHAVANATQVAPGAMVVATGSVFGSGASIQVFSGDFGGVTVLGPPASNLIPLEFVARNAVRLEGQHVVVRAVVADVRTVIDPKHALLQQGLDRMWAYDPSGWAAGTASVTGRPYVTSRGRCELFAGPEANATEVSIAILAACPETLVGGPVRVRNVLVTPGELIGTALTLQDIGDGSDYRIAAFVRDWDRRPAASWMAVGRVVTLEGVVDYQPTEARWRIMTDIPPRP